MARWALNAAAVWAAVLATGAMAGQTLVTSGFANCDKNAQIKVENVDIKYDNTARLIDFNLAGTSEIEQNVTATLTVTAYGHEVYTDSFNPCKSDTYVEQLCPVPAGSFAANGSQALTADEASMIPSIAFQVPDISAQATMRLQSLETKQDVGCVTSQVTNGKSTKVTAVSWVAAGMAGVALVLGGVGAAGAAAAGGGAAPSPTFTEVMGVFQGFAINGMASVKQPSVYRSFASNFGFSAGLIPWGSMQVSIDNMRAATGGNLTVNSYEHLQNTTLVFGSGSSSDSTSSSLKRSIYEYASIVLRDVDTSVNNDTSSADQSQQQETGFQATVSGIEAYVEQLSVPSTNSFMTILLITAIVIAAIIVCLLLVKVILEAWSLWGKFPQSLNGFRKHYWGTIARTITSLIFVLYGVWVLYCVYQFTSGDSWACELLAGLTLAAFTAILAFFTWKIFSTVHKLKKTHGDSVKLYEDKSIWMKYSLFYDLYKKNYWWAFTPLLVYMIAKGVVMAMTDGSGMAQSIGMIIVEGLYLAILMWNRPYERGSGNWVNITIQVVRVLSVVCVLVFVEELGFDETTTTVTGVVMMVLQSVLAGLLAILLCWNAIVICFKENPHRKRRKEMEKMRENDDLTDLTPLEARNSLLHERNSLEKSSNTFAMANTVPEKRVPFASSRETSPEPYSDREPANPYSGYHDNDSHHFQDRSMTPTFPFSNDQGSDNLLSHAAPMSHQRGMPSDGSGFGSAYSHNFSYGGGYDQRSHSPYRG